MPMDLRSELKARGLTDQQLSAKAVEATENLLAEKEGIELETIRGIVQKLCSSIKDYIADLNYAKQEVRYVKEQMETVKERADEYKKGLKSEIINNDRLKETLNFYTALLSRTQEVFGAEKMTEAVIVQLLETSSYGIWRSIMGAKFDEDGYERPPRANRRI
jgi:hypothetical protein